MQAVELKKGVYWVGGIDWDLRHFHGYLTQRGSTYNAYLIVDEIIQALGANVIFEQKRTRNFIDAKEKEKSLNNLYDSFLENSLAYLSHADFPKKFVLKKYKEYLDKNKWYR